MRLEYQISEYNAMQLQQKALILENLSVFLDHDLSLGIIHTLFFYNTYYIEVLVDHESNTLIEILAFKNGPRLDKYLAPIDWKDLF